MRLLLCYLLASCSLCAQAINGGAIIDHLRANQTNNTGAVCFCDTWEVYKVEVYARVRRALARISHKLLAKSRPSWHN